MEEDAIKGKACLITEDNKMVTLPRSKTFPSSAKLEGLSFCMSQEITPGPGTSQQETVQITLEEPQSNLENETYRRDREVRERLALCAPLLQAALKGDWKAGEAFLQKHPDCIALPITMAGGTALHNAAGAIRTTFVKELVKLMSPSDLELKTSAQGSTALMSAVQAGSVTIAKVLVEKNNKLPCIRINSGKTPIGLAASWGPRYKNMVSYLFSVTPNEDLTPRERTDLFLSTISSEMFDIALNILKINPELLADRTPIVWDALKMLASKPLAIGSKSRLSMWERCLNTCQFAFNPSLH